MDFGHCLHGWNSPLAPCKVTTRSYSKRMVMVMAMCEDDGDGDDGKLPGEFFLEAN